MKYDAITPKLDRLDLSQSGISMFLGPTSSAVMHQLWREPATIKQVYNKLRRTSAFEETMYTTIATTCMRLTQRGFLTQQNIATDAKPVYHYTPTMTEHELIAFCLTFILQRFESTFHIKITDLAKLLEQHSEHR